MTWSQVTPSYRYMYPLHITLVRTAFFRAGPTGPARRVLRWTTRSGEVLFEHDPARPTIPSLIDRLCFSKRGEAALASVLSIAEVEAFKAWLVTQLSIPNALTTLPKN